MKITVEQTSKPGYVATKKEFDEFAGRAANICYTEENFEKIKEQSEEEALKRAEFVKKNKHHSCFEHSFITFNMEGIPKILAMLLNNEHSYTTSEKSGRYTPMYTKENEKLYFEWLEIFKDEIVETYPKDKYSFLYPVNKKTGSDMDVVIKKAQENARYTTSIMIPTIMLHSISYRQFNYEYEFICRYLEIEGNKLIDLIKPELLKLKECFEATGYVDDKLSNDGKNRDFSLLDLNGNHKLYIGRDQWGRSYSTTYKGSFAALAQLQRHRTIDYSLELLDKPEFYIPEIIRSKPELVKKWLKDLKGIAHLYPQGMLVSINETGKFEDFILKCKERKCTGAQLETCGIVNATSKEYIRNLKINNDPLYDILLPYTKGARCTFSDYDCLNDCKFPEGKRLERLI